MEILIFTPITIILLVLLIKKTIKLKFLITVGLLVYCLFFMCISYNLANKKQTYPIKTDSKQTNNNLKSDTLWIP